MCAYDSMVIWPAEDGNDRKKTRSHRLLFEITLFLISSPSSTKLCATLCHSLALPSSLNIAITQRARSLLSFPLSPATAKL